VESVIPVLGSGREAMADWHDGDYLGAGLNAALAVSDLFVAGSLVKGIAKGGLYGAKAAMRNPRLWREAMSGNWKRDVRPWLGDQKFLKPNQPGHPWLIPQNGWGKKVPGYIKNQPWNIKPMPSAEIHGRIHHPWKGKPRFNAAQRYWYGTPAWSKWATGSLLGRPVVLGNEAMDNDQ
jgi:hypothetical protein